MIRACHHIAIAVKDLAAAKRFWGEALGLEELKRPKEIEHFTSAWYQLGISELHVVENADFEPLQGPLAPHIAVAVREDDFEAAVARVREAGFEFGFGPAHGPDGILRAVTQDPTGNTVEITVAELRQTSV